MSFNYHLDVVEVLELLFALGAPQMLVDLVRLHVVLSGLGARAQVTLILEMVVSSHVTVHQTLARVSVPAPVAFEIGIVVVTSCIHMLFKGSTGSESSAAFITAPTHGDGGR